MILDSNELIIFMAMRHTNAAELSRKAKMSRTVIWKAQHDMPISEKSIHKVADALSVSVDALVKDT